MSVEKLNQFVGRHSPSFTGLCALVSSLDALALGAPLEPRVAAAAQQLLNGLGGGDVLENITADQARTLVVEVRHMLWGDAQLMHAETRMASWSYADPKVLSEFGEIGKVHATMLNRMVAPQVEGLEQRMSAPGAKFLDVGVGVAGLAVQMAKERANVHVTGIDVFQPSLRLARANIAAAGLESRITLREQSIEAIDDQGVYDLAWIPVPFIPERVVAPGTERVLRALKPGGTAVFAYPDLSRTEGIPQAQLALRFATYGGPSVTIPQVESLCREKGFAKVHTLGAPPHMPFLGVTVARRQD